LHDGDPARREPFGFVGPQRWPVVQQEEHIRAQLPPQVCLMPGQRPGGQHADTSVPDLPPVAVRAVHHVAPPPVRQARHVRQLVNQPGRHQQPPRPHIAPAVQGHQESVAILRRRLDGSAGDLAAVPGHFRSPGRHQLGRWRAIPGQVVVHLTGQGVARLSGVEDQHRAPGPRERQGATEPRRPTADHYYVVLLFSHAPYGAG
jgi:hypothetical protein